MRRALIVIMLACVCGPAAAQRQHPPGEILGALLTLQGMIDVCHAAVPAAQTQALAAAVERMQRLAGFGDDEVREQRIRSGQGIAQRGCGPALANFTRVYDQVMAEAAVPR